MHYNNNFINEFARFLSKTGSETLAVLFQHEMQTQAFYDRQAREQLKQEIIDEIISRFHATVDVTDIVQEIDDLRNSIERLGK